MFSSKPKKRVLRYTVVKGRSKTNHTTLAIARKKAKSLRGAKIYKYKTRKRVY